MKILVIGSGCREHALAWKFAQSEKVKKVYVAPGNGGTAIEGKCANVQLHSGDAALPEGQQELVQFALQEKIDLSVVGPELPLALGIVDRFRAAGLKIIGPDQKAARLEASKAYSKEFMQKYGVRTAQSENFSDAAAAYAFAENHFKAKAAPLVIKADGLAAGKGVVVAQNFAEAEAALRAFMENKSLGEAGNLVLLEEFIAGKEVSVLAAVSVAGGAGHILPFISARDHKRRFDGAQGPNTGGMGAIAPVPDFTAAAQSDFYGSILKPSLNGMIAEGMDYRGFIFFGLMIQNEKCSLLEYNVRLGDPETEAVLPLMDSSLVDLCAAIQDGGLAGFNLQWKKGAACAPVAVADGYPGAYRKGDAINIDWAVLEKMGAKIFTGGVASGVSGDAASGGAGGAAPALQTAGGRVLVVCALGANADEAWANAYRGLTAVSFEGMGYRRDIGREG